MLSCSEAFNTAPSAQHASIQRDLILIVYNTPKQASHSSAYHPHHWLPNLTYISTVDLLNFVSPSTQDAAYLLVTIVESYLDSTLSSKPFSSLSHALFVPMDETRTLDSTNWFRLENPSNPPVTASSLPALLSSTPSSCRTPQERHIKRRKSLYPALQRIPVVTENECIDNSKGR